MNIQPPLLSVIVPFYNNEAFVIAALDSLFTQISDDIEVVIIDDGSTDASGSLVSRVRTSSSVATSRPAACGRRSATSYTEACLRCTAPNASST